MTARAAVPAVLLSLVLVAGCSGTALAPPVPTATTAAASPSRSVDREGLRQSINDQIASGSASYRNIEAIVVRVDGVTVYEQYWNSHPERFRNVFSVTKSVLSTLVGIALDDGILAGLDQDLATSLPQYRRLMSDEVASITIEQLLTMTSGIGGGSGGPISELDAEDYVAEVLRRGTQAEPGTQWQYSDNAANVLAAVLTEALRRHDGHHPQTLLDYARQKLFDPLGVDTRPAYTGFEGNDPFSVRYERAAFGWATDRQGRFYGDAMIRLRARDLANFGQVYLDGGRWHGRQLMPRSWVRDATTSIQLARYGRLWWPIDFDVHAGYAAQGRGGQLVLVVPDLRLVVAIASHLDPDYELRPEDLVAMLSSTLPGHFG